MLSAESFKEVNFLNEMHPKLATIQMLFFPVKLNAVR
jgi:hypothetical protein